MLSDVASIGSVSAGGDISGPIKALNGSIGSIIATGDFTTPLDGATFQVRAKDGIDTIVAHSITAYITACSNCTSSIGTGAGVVGLVKTTGGDFTHSIAMRSLSTSTLSGESGIIVNGSVPSGAVMRFISSGSVSQPITITGSLGGTIQYDSAGALSNQIIVNAANSGGTWGGSVLVDGITLNSGQSQPNQAPYYNQTSSTLGGGAVGLAPFHLHGADCSPANGSSGNSFGSPIRLRFYGPVTWSSGEPVSVDVQDSDGGSFTVSISAGSDPRDILVSVSAGNPMDVPDQIVIQPVSGVLKCANVTGTPNVASFTYSISY